MNMDDFHVEMQRVQQERDQQARTGRIEQRIISALIDTFSLQLYHGLWLREQKAIDGRTTLGLPGFYSLFPDFPVRFFPERYTYLYKIPLVELFTKFDKHPWFARLQDLAKEHQRRDLGLVFEWPKLGLVTISAVPPNDCEDGKALAALCWQLPRKHGTLWLAQLKPYLQHLAWMPPSNA